MKILLTNIHLTQPGGTETWIYTMARELAKTNEVTVFSFNIGDFSDRMKNFCRITNDVNVLQNEFFDLAIVNHRACLRAINSKIYRIFTSHSWFIEEEMPLRIADKCVAISEEILAIVEREVQYAKLIRNGIDCERFSPLKQVNQTLKKVLYLTKGATNATPIIKQACDEMGIEMLTTNGFNYDTEVLINEADLVITVGRGILESMACGRNVISADWRCYHRNFLGAGFISPERIPTLRTHSFSGRNCVTEMSVKKLKEEFAKYNPKIGETFRNLILEDYNVVKNAKKYLEIYERR